jgi:hypothetical protein
MESEACMLTYTKVIRLTCKKPATPRKRLQIIVRAYNEGIAFHYHFAGNEYLHISREYTQFALPETAQAYFTPRAQATYELLPLKDWTGESERPLVLKAPVFTFFSPKPE